MIKRLTEEQIIRVLKEHESGMKVDNIWWNHGSGNSTFYKWKSKYGGFEVSDAKRLSELEAENSKLKNLFADFILDNVALKEVLIKIP